MDVLTGVFTTRPLNPVSGIIRLANPVSFTTPAPASHVITLDRDPNYCFEASMTTRRVQRVRTSTALKGAKVVGRIDYEVPDAEAGWNFLRGEAIRMARYDFKGAFGLGLAPDRNWQDPEDWFCFELHAMALEKAGRKTFSQNARVTANLLMSLDPKFPCLQHRLAA